MTKKIRSNSTIKGINGSSIKRVLQLLLRRVSCCIVDDTSLLMYLEDNVILIQAAMRRFLARRVYLRQRAAIEKLQRWIRRYLLDRNSTLSISSISSCTEVADDAECGISEDMHDEECFSNETESDALEVVTITTKKEISICELINSFSKSNKSYRVTGKIGEGGNGTVFSGESTSHVDDLPIGTQVAIKVIHNNEGN